MSTRPTRRIVMGAALGIALGVAGGGTTACGQAESISTPEPGRARDVLPVEDTSALGIGVGGPDPVAAADRGMPCESLVGRWRWFTGGVVSIAADGTITHEPGNDGTWECTDAERDLATLRWRSGGFVNRLVLSADGRALTSTDPFQSYVTAQRIGALRTDLAAPPELPDQPDRSVTSPNVPNPAVPLARPQVMTQAAPPMDAKRPEDPGQAGPCSGSACISVRVETSGSCVWLRSSANDTVEAEIRLAAETITMILEKPDLTKVVRTSGASLDSAVARQAEAKRRLDALRRQGHDIPYDPTIEGPPATATGAGAGTGDRSRGWHGTVYDPFTGGDRAVFHARIDRAGGCVVRPGEIRSYRATLASAASRESPERVIACTGDACADVDASLEQIGACRLVNRGRREIAVGIARSGNADVSITGMLPSSGTMPLVSFVGCLTASDIGRIEARYK